jgi:hypothetical protein
MAAQAADFSGTGSYPSSGWTITFFDQTNSLTAIRAGAP